MREIFKRNAGNMRRLVHYAEGILKGLADVPGSGEVVEDMTGPRRNRAYGTEYMARKAKRWDPQFH